MRKKEFPEEKTENEEYNYLPTPRTNGW